MRTFHYTEVPAEPAPDLPGVRLRWVMGKNVDAPNYATRVIAVEAGAATEYHAHPWEHEVFVLQGSGLVRGADDVETSICPGMCVYVAPDEIHQFLNFGSVPLEFICIIPNTAGG